MRNFLLTCSSFLSSFSLIMFVKLFLIQKLKSSTNLNPTEEKEEKTTIDYSTTISDLPGKMSVIHPRTIFLCGSCPRGQ